MTFTNCRAEAGTIGLGIPMAPAARRRFAWLRKPSLVSPFRLYLLGSLLLACFSPALALVLLLVPAISLALGFVAVRPCVCMIARRPCRRRRWLTHDLSVRSGGRLPRVLVDPNRAGGPRGRTTFSLRSDCDSEVLSLGDAVHAVDEGDPGDSEIVMPAVITALRGDLIYLDVDWQTEVAASGGDMANTREQEQEQVIHALRETWRANPEWRLTQVIHNALSPSGSVMDPRLYNLTDARALRELRDFVR